MTPNAGPNLIRSADVCERLGIHRATLTRWVATGRIAPAVKLPGLRGAYLFTQDEVDRAVRANVATEQAS